MCGLGTMFYSSGIVAYHGNFVNDKFDGFGKLYNENIQPLNY